MGCRGRRKGTLLHHIPPGSAAASVVAMATKELLRLGILLC